MLPDHGLGSWPDRLARRSPDAVALAHDGATTTYRRLAERTRALAGGLQRAGVRRGDRVAFLGGNHPAFLEVLFACGRLGAIFVPLNTRLAPPELTYQLDDCGATVLLHDAARAEAAQAAAAGTTSARVPLVAVEAPDYAALLDGAGSPDLVVGADDAAMIMYTSGTTGLAKGVVLTHANLTWNSLNVVLEVDLHAGEIALIVSPLFHSAALCMNALPVLLKGGTLVLASSARPEEMLRLIRTHHVTHLQGVPTIYQALAEHPDWPDADLSSVRRASSGGSAASISLIRSYLDRGVPFAQGYGMTETGPGACFLPPREIARKIGSVGVPMFFTDVRVVDEAGADVAPGVPGEVLVSGPNVSPGYWGRPDDTAAARTPAGEHRSGDLATVDADGHLRIVDRVKDMYISGGENVYPAEIEAVLNEHPDVAECAVIAVPDERWGDVGRALVVPVDGAAADPAALLSWLDGRLARYKIPKSLQVVDGLPRTAAGKVRKADLRERYGSLVAAAPLQQTPPRA